MHKEKEQNSHGEVDMRVNKILALAQNDMHVKICENI